MLGVRICVFVQFLMVLCICSDLGLGRLRIKGLG